MKKTLTTHDIANALLSDENANWSRSGAFALAEYLEEYEESTGEEQTLDVVAIRCDYSEYDSLFSWADEYYGNIQSIPCEWLRTVDGTNNIRINEDLVRSHILDHGQLIEFQDGVIVSAF
tara:strand:+ start:92 stop:451 length:360 start_codon:yes stop_codon:yes gene_type:complete